MVAVVGLLALTSLSFAVRIKDVTHVEGMRDNQLIGYGLVVGLNGTGDSIQISFAISSLAAFLRRSGVNIDPSTVQVKNTAAVVVTANLPPFAKNGQRLDVIVSSIGDASNLQGGTVLMTPLKGGDGQVYAVAQGPISIGGYTATGGGTSVTKNHPTAGTVPDGALVERISPTKLEGRQIINLVLDNPDFTTSRRIETVINLCFKNKVALATDSTGVTIKVPQNYRSDLAGFLAEIERLPIHPDQRARVIIDERTGTVVMGEDVRISTLAIAHGSLSLQITQENKVSQPGPLSNGTTTPIQNTSIKAKEEKGDLEVVAEGVSLGEVVQSLNAIGVTPRDLIAILQSIKACGALQAELVIR
jgi:flagellar P-ring protein precursor FlgI